LTPPGSTLERTDEIADQLQKIAGEIEDVKSVSSLAGFEILSEGTGANSGTCLVNLKNWKERKHSVQQVISELEERTKSIKGATIEYFPPPAVPGYGAAGGFELRLLDKAGTGDYKLMEKVSNDFVKELSQRPELESVFTFYSASYPQYMLNIDNDKDRQIIEASIRQIESKGTNQWCGYSFSWMACIYARARQAENAIKQLEIFASNFCSANSFHLNGDQKGGQYSSVTYRPFTLEGNFAFAQGVHELLVQCRNGRIEVFPAVPVQWKDVSFKTLRAEGAFLVSANREGGVVTEVTVKAEQGGRLELKLPFKTFFITNLQKKYELANGILEAEMEKGETIIIKNGYE